jgi:polysaccharide biosynthesis transport protein
VLNQASIPTEHSRPRILFNVLISIFLGTLLAVGVALMLELRNRRVRSVEDLAEVIDLPVLATISVDRSRLNTVTRKRRLLGGNAARRQIGWEAPEH